MIGASVLFAFVALTDANSPAVGIAQPKGQLIRSGRDGDAQQSFDVYPKFGTLLFRNRQLAFDDGHVLTWITPGNGTAHANVDGKTLIGWRDGEPLLFDGKEASTSSGLKIPLGIREGDKPVFA